MEQTMTERSAGNREQKDKKGESPEYGNWVSTKFIYGPGIAGLMFIAVSILFRPLIFIAAIFFLLALYFAYARRLFSEKGSGVQNRIWDLVVDHLEWDGKGKLLDIGCGNGALTIKLAKKYPRADLHAIDYWGKNWNYSKAVCEKNAILEGVNSRIMFMLASASTLPFEEGAFDAVVSNLTFHEVRDAKDKRKVVREALRVLRKDGVFVFQDLFLIKQYYGTPAELINTIKSWGIREVKFVDTHNETFIPAVLKLPFMVGTIGMLIGKK